MSEPYLKLHLLIDDYVSGVLSDERRAVFEERLLWDDALVEEVALADALRRALKAHPPIAALQSHSESPASRLSLRDWSPALAIAATVLLAVSVTFNVVQFADFSPITPGSVTTATPQVVRLIATRGTASIEVGIEADSLVVLTIDPVPGFDEYRLTLSSAADTASIIAEQSELHAAQNRPLALAAPASELPPDDYVLAVFGRRQAETEYRQIGEVRFRATSGL